MVWKWVLCPKRTKPTDYKRISNESAITPIVANLGLHLMTRFIYGWSKWHSAYLCHHCHQSHQSQALVEAIQSVLSLTSKILFNNRWLLFQIWNSRLMKRRHDSCISCAFDSFAITGSNPSNESFGALSSGSKQRIIYCQKCEKWNKWWVPEMSPVLGSALIRWLRREWWVYWVFTHCNERSFICALDNNNNNNNDWFE